MNNVAFSWLRGRREIVLARSSGGVGRRFLRAAGVEIPPKLTRHEFLLSTGPVLPARGCVVLGVGYSGSDSSPHAVGLFVTSAIAGRLDTWRPRQ